ncbi:competence type IV pilus minor pilin ComGF [Furfurilactobacillus rossiae]|uniref:competence type IV pilus minor pilin ComGF n=1 Tax=Furfurilactobacillus rossiae TaxID=231049 RepID=UPI001265DF3E|nr:competence type IV pilus minor pilin ComGF [Furfurilactobacillus rossiae]MCF6166556.1 ComGF family competence protein [Furfurilactobacillus rossiae]QFR66291.1 hypothetical protein LR814_03940 [Furfurilactobacillus rossiae]QLE61738.1 hypothetical protein LROSRS0_1693 [Furfurilactobacillus rossiae]QLE64538.1 hypothetical protein LROSL1_1722 [Furfurilactobacillus rossiae]
MVRVRSRPAFTIVETLWGLTIGVLVLFTVTLTLQQLRYNASNEYQSIHQLDNTVMHLGNPEEKFRFESQQGNEVRLIGQTHKGVVQHYRLVAKRNNLIMTTTKGGYMPLVENISDASMMYANGCLTISFKTRHHRQVSRTTFLPEASLES